MSTAVRSLPSFERNATASAPRLYTLSDLGVHLDGAPLLPVAINETGEICVYAASAQPPGRTHGFCLSGTLRVPAAVASRQSPVTSLNRRGFLAGTSGSSPRTLRAWASHLGSFGSRLWPDFVSVARGINAGGQVVGNVLHDAGAFALSRAFLVSPAGAARYLTPPQGGTTVATGLNDAGAIALNAAPLGAAPGDSRAWCHADDCFVAIPTLGGSRAWATAITPEGRIVGHSTTADGDTHAFLWTPEGEITDLGSLPGRMSQALAANDDGVVVGRVLDALGGPRAIRWTPDGGLELLEEHVAAPHGWVLHEAVGLNAAGAIVGRGTLHGRPRGFLLRPAG